VKTIVTNPSRNPLVNFLNRSDSNSGKRFLFICFRFLSWQSCLLRRDWVVMNLYIGNGIPRDYIAPDKVVTAAEFVILRLLLPLPAAKEWLDHDVLDRTSAAVQIQQ
jgi:hypothetical protein